MNENPQVEMELMVQVPGRPPYPAKRKQFVPLILLGRLSTGAPLAVKVDSADPNNVEIDWDAPALAPDAAQGWWGAAPSGAATSAGQGSETMQEVQAALTGSGLQAEKAFSFPEQANYTVDQVRDFLRANGLSGTATIERLEDTGKDVGDDHLFTMEATVNVPGRPPHRGPPSAAMVPKAKMGQVYVGAILPVKVAADNPDAVMFEWDKI